MALTRDFRVTIKARAERDPAFRKELLREGVECLLAGDIDTGKTILRDYINATLGFVDLAQAAPILANAAPLHTLAAGRCGRFPS